MEHTTMEIIGVWIGALLTLGILSFLYKDNILYKIAEAVFIGISAGYWFITYFWDNIYKKAFVGIFIGENQTLPDGTTTVVHDYFLLVGVVLGILMLLRLSSKIGWIARWPIAFIVGATAGLKLMVYLVTDAIAQVDASVRNMIGLSAAGEIIGQSVVLIGTMTALVYFFFSKEHRGAFGVAAKFGTWILMITFGASFGYTVMSRMSLLIGRVDFLLTDWLKLIR